MSQLPDQHQGKLSKCKQLSYLHVAKHPFCFIKLIENKSRSNPTTFSAIYDEVTVLQCTVPEYTLGQLAWEKSMLDWEIEHLQKCCQDLEREKAHVEGQLQREKHKWLPRFLNAIGAKTNTPREASINVQRSTSNSVSIFSVESVTQIKDQKLQMRSPIGHAKRVPLFTFFIVICMLLINSISILRALHMSIHLLLIRHISRSGGS